MWLRYLGWSQKDAAPHETGENVATENKYETDMVSTEGFLQQHQCSCTFLDTFQQKQRKLNESRIQILKQTSQLIISFKHHKRLSHGGLLRDKLPQCFLFINTELLLVRLLSV